jgi:hypothetical protein
MGDLQFLLILMALICFVLASCGVNLGRIGLLPLGMAFWALSVLVR